MSGATIGEHSVFESLLGDKAVEKFGNVVAFLTSAVQRDLVKNFDKQADLSITRNTRSGVTCIEIVINIPDLVCMQAGYAPVFENHFPDFAQFVNSGDVKELRCINRLNVGAVQDTSQYGWLYFMGNMNFFVGLQHNGRATDFPDGDHHSRKWANSDGLPSSTDAGG